MNYGNIIATINYTLSLAQNKVDTLLLIKKKKKKNRPKNYYLYLKEGNYFHQKFYQNNYPPSKSKRHPATVRRNRAMRIQRAFRVPAILSADIELRSPLTNASANAGSCEVFDWVLYIAYIPEVINTCTCSEYCSS